MQKEFKFELGEPQVCEALQMWIQKHFIDQGIISPIDTVIVDWWKYIEPKKIEVGGKCSS